MSRDRWELRTPKRFEGEGREACSVSGKDCSSTARQLQQRWRQREAASSIRHNCDVCNRRSVLKD